MEVFDPLIRSRPNEFEDTNLYALIGKASKMSLKNAWLAIGDMEDKDVLRRSETNCSTYLHHVVNQAPVVHSKYGNVNALVPLIYRLALRGVNPCARNSHGNTCLHLACLRPHAEPLCAHLIRIGADPCIQNSKGIRIIHTYRNHVFEMVKGQASAKSGLWNAVQREDADAVERLLRSWCRVNVRRNKSLRQLAEETSNAVITRLLDSYEATGELVAAAFACDVDRVRSLLHGSRNAFRRAQLRRGSAALISSREFFTCSRPNSSPGKRSVKTDMLPGQIDLNLDDEACEVPKPLVAALQEIGSCTRPVVQLLLDAGASGDLSDYAGKVSAHRVAFETSELFGLIYTASEASLQRALDLIQSGEVDVSLRGYSPASNDAEEQEDDDEEEEEDEEQETEEVPQRAVESPGPGRAPRLGGWTYLHLVVDSYVRAGSGEQGEERRRLLTRAIYRLALAGVDVNARDTAGCTALVNAAAATAALNGGAIDQLLVTHLIRVGVDAALPDAHGWTVSEQVYEDRGKLIFGKRYRIADLPGLWAAVMNNDPAKAVRYLHNWARVDCTKGERTLREVATDLGHTEIRKLLDAYEKMNEFVCATFACDMELITKTLAHGGGEKKVNTIDDFFHVGSNVKRYAEFVRRPIIVGALELCTPEVIEFLINFGADLSKFYDEPGPRGPTAFWAMRDHVTNDNAVVVARHADLTLRNELGMTLLHAAVSKKRLDGRNDVISTLLARFIDVAARDFEGSTARDYITLFKIEDGATVRNLIDDHVLDMVRNDQLYRIESLLIDSYDHITDIRTSKRHRSAVEIAEMKLLLHIVHFFNDYDKYKKELESLHEAARDNDMSLISRNIGEKRCAMARDKAGRTLLHTAVLYNNIDIVRFLLEHFPHLVNSRDSVNRTPLHLCVCLENRHAMWQVLQQADADPRLVDANNMSTYDYVRELEKETPPEKKSRGRRWRDYKPSEIIEKERSTVYGLRANSHVFHEQLMERLSPELTVDDVKTLNKSYKPVNLSIDELDVSLLKKCVELRLEYVIVHLLDECGCRPEAPIPISEASGDGAAMTTTTQILADIAVELELHVVDSYINGRFPGSAHSLLWRDGVGAAADAKSSDSIANDVAPSSLSRFDPSKFLPGETGGETIREGELSAATSVVSASGTSVVSGVSVGDTGG